MEITRTSLISRFPHIDNADDPEHIVQYVINQETGEILGINFFNMSLGVSSFDWDERNGVIVTTTRTEYKPLFSNIPLGTLDDLAAEIEAGLSDISIFTDSNFGWNYVMWLSSKDESFYAAPIK